MRMINGHPQERIDCYRLANSAAHHAAHAADTATADDLAARTTNQSEPIDFRKRGAFVRNRSAVEAHATSQLRTLFAGVHAHFYGGNDAASSSSLHSNTSAGAAADSAASAAAVRDPHWWLPHQTPMLDSMQSSHAAAAAAAAGVDDGGDNAARQGDETTTPPPPLPFHLKVAASQVRGAGVGVFVRGTAKHGSVVALYPGVAYAREHFGLLTADARPLENMSAPLPQTGADNEYVMGTYAGVFFDAAVDAVALTTHVSDDAAAKAKAAAAAEAKDDDDDDDDDEDDEDDDDNDDNGGSGGDATATATTKKKGEDTAGDVAAACGVKGFESVDADAATHSICTRVNPFALAHLVNHPVSRG
jgi:hypothetical protein